MPRNMSFSLTTDQIRDRSKDVTRRIAWLMIKPGDIVTACVKCMGLKPGEKIERLGNIRIVKVTREPLSAIRNESIGAAREGFPDMTSDEFIEMFCKHMNVTEDAIITRIEFEHMEASE